MDKRPKVIPWDTLRYLIGEAMYGGRVSDDYDRRVLKTYLKEYMGDFIFEKTFFFSRAGGFDYTLPASNADLKSANEMISTIPISQVPGVFGLDANAEVTYLANAGKDICMSLISMQTGEGDAPAAEEGAPVVSARDQIVGNICQGILKRLSEQQVLRYVILNQSTPTEVVLCQEIERYNTLVERIISSLSDLKRALKGEIGMSQELDEIGASLFNGFIPDKWKRLSPESQKPVASWMDQLSRRYAQYSTWITERRLPAVLWLSGLHVPESMLSALVQTTCRSKGWALDKSVVFTQVTRFTDKSQISSPLEFGTFVEGLFLEGAEWDVEKGYLIDQRPKQLVVPMPIIEIVPVESSDQRLLDPCILPTPVYCTQSRRSAMGVGLCFEANLRTVQGQKQSIWILQGVALFLNIDN